MFWLLFDIIVCVREIYIYIYASFCEVIFDEMQKTMRRGVFGVNDYKLGENKF